MNKRNRIPKIIERIAVENHTSAEEVRNQMKLAIQCGMENPDPKVQEMWRSIPSKGSVPTPEEFILWAVGKALL